MKNSLNIVFIALLFVVLGCSCQRLQEMANQQSSTPSTTPYTANTSTSPSSNTATTTSKSGLSLDKYNQIKNGMTYKEVVDIMGSEGTEIMSSGEGRYKVTSYQWKGDNFEYLSIVLMGDKVTSKTQANLK